jgi:hypothetical protein
VPVQFPGAGWTTIPGRLVDTENVGVLEDNGERDILAEYLAADGRGTSTAIRSPSRAR